MSVKTTAKTHIMRVLAACQPGVHLAVHEIAALIGPRYSENALATRVSELAAAGRVVGRARTGKSYREWRLALPGEKAGLTVTQNRRAGPTLTVSLAAHSTVQPDMFQKTPTVLVTLALTPDQWDAARAGRAVRFTT